MPMALKREVVEAQRRQTDFKPIDLVHLGQQTMGDEALESELLGMFSTQSRIYLKMILNSCDSPTRIRAAHSLKGASRSIGAFQLGDLAEQAEKFDHQVHGDLQTEHDRVIAYIDTLR